MSNDSLPRNFKKAPEYVRKQMEELSYEGFKKSVDRFVRQSGLRLKAGDWLYDQEPSDEFFSGEVKDFKLIGTDSSSSIQMPFVEKHELPPHAKVIVVGDVHGHAEALIDVLEQLRKQGLLDDQYALTNDDYYLVFVGDYTNRMPHSVEVMLLLFYLHTKNIGTVFLLRGNHEIAICNKDFYEKYDYINDNEPGAQGMETLLGELAQKFELYYFPDLLYWYDYLPMANFISCKDANTGMLNTIQFCHAGLEVGYNPGNLLASTEARFQRIMQLNRYNAVQKMLNNKELRPVHERIELLAKQMKKQGFGDEVNTYVERNIIDFADQHSLVSTKVGLQWNSFLTEANDDIELAASAMNSSLYLGRRLTQYLLDQAAGQQNRIVSVVRGHQHMNDFDEALGLNSNMLDVVNTARGCVRQWDGLLYTMGDLGIECKHQAFLVINFADTLQGWNVEHYYKGRKDSEFACEKGPFLGVIE